MNAHHSALGVAAALAAMSSSPCRRHVNGCVTGVDYIRLAQSTAVTAPERTFIIFSQIKWSNIIRQKTRCTGGRTRSERLQFCHKSAFAMLIARMRVRYVLVCVSGNEYLPYSFCTF